MNVPSEGLTTWGRCRRCSEIFGAGWRARAATGQVRYGGQPGCTADPAGYAAPASRNYPSAPNCTGGRGLVRRADLWACSAGGAFISGAWGKPKVQPELKARLYLFRDFSRCLF